MSVYEVRDSDLMFGVNLGTINFLDLVMQTNPDTPFAAYHDDVNMAYRAKCENKPANSLSRNVIWREVRP